MMDELDQIPMNEPYILNTDTTDGAGIHWMTIYRTPKQLFYYDPLSTKVQPVHRSVKEWASQNNIQVIPNIFNHQPMKSNLCGYFAIHMALIFKKMRRMTQKIFEDTLLRVHGPDSDIGDVKRVLDGYF